jgi:hypothetical protein
MSAFLEIQDALIHPALNPLAVDEDVGERVPDSDSEFGLAFLRCGRALGSVDFVWVAGRRGRR